MGRQGRRVACAGSGLKRGASACVVRRTPRPQPAGMDGYFKIKQGDSGINDKMYGCRPDLAA